MFYPPTTATADPAPSQFSDSDFPTIDALIEQNRKQAAAAPKKQPAEKPQSPLPAPSEAAPTEAVKAIEQPPAETETKTEAESTEQKELEPGSPEALEHEAKEQGAFDPETGEINWDCPCLGGMAHGPCGEEFKAAFSCFVYSKEEPKGMDCIEKFQYVTTALRGTG